MRGATDEMRAMLDADEISIHAPHAGSDASNFAGAIATVISIHAPHAGSDQYKWNDHYIQAISIHAPHAGSDDDERAH